MLRTRTLCDIINSSIKQKRSFIISGERLLVNSQERLNSTYGKTNSSSLSSSIPSENKKSSPSSIPTNNETNKLKAMAELTKLRLSALVVGTTTAGYISFFASSSSESLLLLQTPSPLVSFTGACLGTALCSASAASLNQIYEVDRDTQMNRTKSRPLVTGALNLQEAKRIAVGSGILGSMTLACFTNPTTTLLGAGNIALYAGLYTYLKPRSEWNTWVGAVVGAIPPVMGYAAAGGDIFDLHSILLASQLYLWQFPHFMALSYMHRIDYARGGFQMIPCHDQHGDRTSWFIKSYTSYLMTLPILSSLLDVTSYMFALEGMLLNGYLGYLAIKFDKERTNSNAKNIFLTSLWYLPTWFVLFLLHSKAWNEENITQEEGNEINHRHIRTILSKYVAQVKSFGKQHCLHEHFYNQQDKCIVLSTKQGIDQVENGIEKAIENAKDVVITNDTN